MNSEPKRLSSAEAIETIRNNLSSGKRVLGVDGFVVTPEGFVALLDLILDVSGDDITNVEAAEIAQAFVRSKAREDVVFDICTEE